METIGFGVGTSDSFFELDLDADIDGEPLQDALEPLAPDEALMRCLDERGAVDMERICELSGLSAPEAVDALKGAVIRDPDGWDGVFTHGFILREQYLSGNLITRLGTAVTANERYHGLFGENIAALNALIPSIAVNRSVRVTLGASWVPPEIIDDFVSEKLGFGLDPDDQTIYDPVSSTWSIPYASCYKNHVRSISTYGTYDMPALRILEKTLNALPVEVYRPTSESDSKRDIDREKTMMAQNNQRRIIEAFDEWVFADENRTRLLHDRYDSVFGRVSNRRFDGSFLTFPGMNSLIRLHDHQLSAIARIVFNRNTLLAHDVGAGKTYTMIAGGECILRMGLSEKNMYVIPNSIMGQWESDYRFLMPEADILVVDRRNFCPAKRRKTLELIRDGHYKTILITASCFAMIPLSRQERIDELKRQRAWLMSVMNGVNVRKKAVLREINRINDKIADLEEEAETDRILGRDEGICFDHLGVTALFVDEAHEYKNVTVRTRTKAVFGICRKGSVKCDGMFDKVHYTQRNGRGAVFATATPISNSITDVFIMQSYLQPGELKYLDLSNFDNWSNTFARREESVELDVDGMSLKTVTRLAHFHNLTELSALFGQVADFYVEPDEIRDAHHTVIDIEVDSTPELAEYFRSLSGRADAVRSGQVKRDEDNLLKITTDGRKGALDLRMMEDYTCCPTATKTYHCALKVFEIWKRTAEQRLTQLVFCDLSTPKKGFNVYDELKHILVSLGVPADEIAFIHDASSDAEKCRLFDSVNRGDIRVLIGSTRKLGTGVNVQRLLTAVHHLDVPWKPSDITQREGRMLRQGNECATLSVYRYVTRNSFDAFSWQLLQLKQDFISQFLSNTLDAESECDFDELALSFAQIKALAVGDPNVRRYIETQNRLNHLLSLQRAHMSHRRRIDGELRELPVTIARQRARISTLSADAETVAASEKPDKEERRALGEELLDAIAGNVMQPTERYFCDFMGLDVILPANMLEEEPLVILRGKDSTVVSLGNDLFGNVRRLQIAADNLASRAEKAKDVLETLIARQDELERELSVSDPYSDEIALVRLELQALELLTALTSDDN